MTLKIRNAGSEPLYTAGLMDAARTLLTGLSDVYLRVRRDSDGYYLDFSDDTFKASPTTIQVAMTEVDATNLPGVYRYNFDLSSVTNEVENEVYHFRVNCASAVNAPQEGVIITDDLEAKAGWGDYAQTVWARDSEANGIPGATVQIRNPASTIVIAKNTTDSIGQATFMLDAGSYKVYVYASGYSFTNPYTLTVSGDGSVTYTGTGDGSFEITPPTSPDVCRVYGYSLDLAGAVIEGMKVRAELSSRSAYVVGAASGTLIAKPHASAKTDANGQWYLDLIPNADLEVEPSGVTGESSSENDTTYTFYFEAPAGVTKKYLGVTVPDLATADFKTLV